MLRQAAAPAEVEVRRVGPSATREFFRRLARTRTAGIGAGIVGLVILAALLAPLLAPYDPTQQDTRS